MKMFVHKTLYVKSTPNNLTFYCKHCHIGLPVKLLMAYLVKFNGSLLLNGCNVKSGLSSYFKYSCDLDDLR